MPRGWGSLLAVASEDDADMVAPSPQPLATAVTASIAVRIMASNMLRVARGALPSVPWQQPSSGLRGMPDIRSREGSAADAGESVVARRRGSCMLHMVFTLSSVMPLKYVLGATQDKGRRNRVRIWYCKPQRSGSAATAKLQYQLHQSDWYECDTELDAQQLVVSVQRAAAWGGKEFPPRIVAVVNPASGQGKGEGVFHSSVLPLLRDVAGMKVDVRTTTGRLHATQMMKELDLDGVDLLLFVGGDGTTFEGMQGLLGRPDWQRAAKVPFGSIPTGSGNGLAASCGLWDPVTAAFSACKRRTHPIDVASVLQPPSTRYYMQLSLTYGFMANIDIGTEHLRWMGEPRFTVGGVRELLAGKTWPLRAAYWPASLNPPGSEPSSHQATSPSQPQRQRSTAMNGNEAAADADTNSLKVALLGQGSINSHEGHTPALNFDAFSSPDRVSGAGGLAASGKLAGSDQQACQQGCLADYPPGPPLPILSQFGATLPQQLPVFEEQLPAGWQMLPEEASAGAQYFYLHNTTHVALNAPLNPKGRQSDGVWELIHASGLHGFSGKMRGAQMLLAADSGTAVDMPWVKTQPLRALVLEPLAGDTTWLVVDGEQIRRDKPVFMEVHPQLCTALVAPDWTDGMNL